MMPLGGASMAGLAPDRLRYMTPCTVLAMPRTWGCLYSQLVLECPDRSDSRHCSPDTSIRSGPDPCQAALRPAVPASFLTIPACSAPKLLMAGRCSLSHTGSRCCEYTVQVPAEGRRCRLQTSQPWQSMLCRRESRWPAGDGESYSQTRQPQPSFYDVESGPKRMP